ncbi:MAG: hypothetical protein G8345_13760 [Magnetococcales bacterium]|nr:hypothetical protein [Magnetococcales bacterium]
MTTACLTGERLRQGPACVVDFAETGPPRLFVSPVQQCFAWSPDQVIPLLKKAERWSHAGLWVVLAVGYEAAAAFDLPVVAGQGQETPLAWCGGFQNFQLFHYPPVAENNDLPGVTVVPALSQEGYQSRLRQIQEALLAGESYQVNFTLPHTVEGLAAEESFLRVQAAGRYPYAAWLSLPVPQGGAWKVASFSPELFLARKGNRLISAPIKGTRGRGASVQEEIHLRQELTTSPKEQAEHIMIVDMVRNDLGRVCRTGSVQVERLKELRIFESLLHLETRVEGEMKVGVGLAELFTALFPAASVTGAPKHRTMHWIAQLETAPRGLYTGTIGLLEPGGDFTLNVAIRTLEWPGQEQAVLGLGGGIVADSHWQREWQELAEKAAFLTRPPTSFHLFETLLWQGEPGYLWLEEHLQRLSASARQLAFPLDVERAREALFSTPLSGPCVVRLALHGDGSFTVQLRPAPQEKSLIRVRLSPILSDRLSYLTRHKTSRRRFLDSALETALQDGMDDMLFFNGDGHLTSGAIRAILIRHHHCWLAPALSCGILPSIWRKHLVQQLVIQETEITLQVLLEADEILMGNSVRRSQSVVSIEDSEGKVVWKAKSRNDATPRNQSLF